MVLGYARCCFESVLEVCICIEAEIGEYSRHLALAHDCNVTGITISGRQVEIARKLSAELIAPPSLRLQDLTDEATQPARLGAGSVTFVELDAEKMGEYFCGRGRWRRREIRLRLDLGGAEPSPE